MNNGSVDFQKSKAMPPRIDKDLVIAVVLALLPVILVAVLIVTGNGRSQEAETVAPDGSSTLSEGPSLAREPASFVEAPAGDFDYQEMAEFYAANGLLGRDSFDVEEAAELSGLRWQAMAEFYEANGLLTRGAPQSNADLDRFTVAPNAEQARAYAEGLESDFQSNPYLTEPGWLQARDYEASQSKRGVVLPEEEYAFYTERYWKAAAGSQSAQPVEEPAYTPSYLERGR